MVFHRCNSWCSFQQLYSHNKTYTADEKFQSSHCRFQRFLSGYKYSKWSIFMYLMNFRCFEMECQQIYSGNSNECLYNHSFAVVLSRLSCQQIAVPLCHGFINRYGSSEILVGTESLLINVRSISALPFRFSWSYQEYTIFCFICHMCDYIMQLSCSVTSHKSNMSPTKQSFHF